jgi:hypothetical protein
MFGTLDYTSEDDDNVPETKITLLLKIIEEDKDTQMTDNELYILYDRQLERFEMYGRRFDSQDRYPKYNFHFALKDQSVMLDFLSQMLCVNSWLTFVMYSNIILPDTKHSYDCIEETLSGFDELFAYDRTICSMNSLKMYVDFLVKVKSADEGC